MIFVDDEMKFKDGDDIHVVCEFCQKVEKIQFSTYKERMRSEYQSLGCNKCEAKMKETPKKLKCNFRGCKKSFDFIPYFFKVMGFKEPTKCRDCRQFVEDKCVNCNQEFVKKLHEWKRKTKDG